MKTSTTQFFFSFILLGILFSFGAYFVNVQGDATLGVTLNNNPDLEAGLVAHYTFDSAADVITDHSGQGNHGYFNNGGTSTLLSVGKIGQGMKTNLIDDDADGNVTIPFTDVSSYPFTLAGWAYVGYNVGNITTMNHILTIGSTASNFHGIGFGEDNGITYSPALVAYNGVYDELDSTTRFFPIGRWVHIVGVYNSATSRDLYIDGEYSVSDTDSRTIGTINELTIADQNDGPNGNEHHGGIDDLRVYNRALSTSEISRLYELGATTKVGTTITTNDELENGLVLHYTFDSDSIDISSSTGEIRDRSPEREDGDWLNHSSTTVPGKIGQAIEINGGLEDIVVADGYTTHFAEDFSIATWFYVRNIPSGDSGLWTTYGGSSGDRMYGDLDQGQYVKVSLDGGDNGFNTNQNDAIPVGYQIPEFWDTWHHTVFVRDNSGDAYIYIDGVLRAATSTFHPGTYTLTGNDLLQVADGRNARHDGYLDDFRIYNRTLSADEIVRLYELGATTKISKTIKTTSLEDGLLAHWTFDGSLSNIVADVAGGNDGYFYNASVASSTLTSPGKIGQALNLIDVSDYVLTTSDIGYEGLSAMSIAFWMKHKNGQSDNHDVISDFGGAPANVLDINYGANESLNCALNADTQESVTPVFITDDEWYHIVCTYDGSNLIGYVNGTLSDTQPLTGVIDSTTSALDIGTGDNASFDGLLDDIRIYNRAISQEEVQRLFNEAL